MGSAVSSKPPEYSYWTKEEQTENEECERNQKLATQYVLEHLFYGVPTYWGKKSRDPKSPLWFEVDPEIVKTAGGHLDNGLLKTVPSGVSVDGNGNMKILFTTMDLSYDLKLNDVKEAAKASACPTPTAPSMTKCNATSISLSWTFPQPPGLAQQVEVQYSRSKPKKITAKALTGLLANNYDTLPWKALCTKCWDLPSFSSYSVENLHPGDGYMFRMRYRSYLGWSEYSEPSEAFFTLPDRPSSPEAPICVSILSDTIQLYWTVPERNNGRPVTQYILRGRSVGDEFAILYSGPMQFFLATGLYPEFAYTFEVAAVNDIGCSPFSPSISIQTPAVKGMSSTRRAAAKADDLFDTLAAEAATQYALQCRDAWIERWDPKTEQYFYFNRLTGTRQLERPAVLDTKKASDDAVDDEPDPNQAAADAARELEMQFRKKRFHLTRALRKHASQLQASGVVSAGAMSTRASPATASRRNPWASPGPGNTRAAPPTPTTPAGPRGPPGSARASTRHFSDEEAGLTSSSNSGGNSSSSSSSNIGNASPSHSRADVFGVELRRPSLLADAFFIIEEAPLVQLFQRMKVEFVGEAGIDSGGLGKEAFLLLSRETSAYVGPTYRGWMRVCSGATPSSSAPPSPARPGLARREEAGLFFSEDWQKRDNSKNRKNKQAGSIVSASTAGGGAGTRSSSTANPSAASSSSASSASSSSSSSSSLSNSHKRGSPPGDGDKGEVESLPEDARDRWKRKNLSIRTTIDEEDESPSPDYHHSNRAGCGDEGKSEKQHQASRERGLVASREEKESKVTPTAAPYAAPSSSLVGVDSVLMLDVDPRATGPRFAHFLGRLLAKALFDRQLVDCRLSPLLLRHLVGLAAIPVTPPERTRPSTGVKGPGSCTQAAFGGSSSGGSNPVTPLRTPKSGLPPTYSTPPTSTTGAGTDTGPNDASRPSSESKSTTYSSSRNAKPLEKSPLPWSATGRGTSDSRANLTRQLDVPPGVQQSDPESDTGIVSPKSAEEIDIMLSDIRMLDGALYSSLLWMLSNDISGIIFETFCTESPDGQIIDLCADGRLKDVTEANKFEYVSLLVQWKTNFSVAQLLEPFLKGFHELAPVQLLRDADITADELDLMLNGRPTLDVEEIRAYCVYQGGQSGGSDSAGGGREVFGEGHRTVVWLWQVLREMSEDERRALLLFFTGSARVPLDGYDPPLNITEGVDMVEDSLPRAHTCFNQLVLPRYSTFQKMKERIRFAVINTEGFGMA